LRKKNTNIIKLKKNLINKLIKYIFFNSQTSPMNKSWIKAIIFSINSAGKFFIFKNLFLITTRWNNLPDHIAGRELSFIYIYINYHHFCPPRRFTFTILFIYSTVIIWRPNNDIFPFVFNLFRENYPSHYFAWSTQIFKFNKKNKVPLYIYIYYIRNSHSLSFPSLSPNPNHRLPLHNQSNPSRCHYQALTSLLHQT